MSRFYKFNANYWNKNIDDCTIRSLSFGTGYGYFHILTVLGLPWKIGRGMAEDGGVDIDTITESFSSILEEIYVDNIYWDYFSGKKVKKDVFIDPEIGDTIHDFGEMYSNTGRYILFVRPGKKTGSQDWHCVYFNSNNNTYYDTWDSGRYIIFGAYRINIQKIPDEDDFSRKSEKNKISEYVKTKNDKLLKF